MSLILQNDSLCCKQSWDFKDLRSYNAVKRRLLQNVCSGTLLAVFLQPSVRDSELTEGTDLELLHISAGSG